MGKALTLAVLVVGFVGLIQAASVDKDLTLTKSQKQALDKVIFSGKCQEQCFMAQ